MNYKHLMCTDNIKRQQIYICVIKSIPNVNRGTNTYIIGAIYIIENTILTIKISFNISFG